MVGGIVWPPLGPALVSLPFKTATGDGLLAPRLACDPAAT